VSIADFASNSDEYQDTAAALFQSDIGDGRSPLQRFANQKRVSELDLAACPHAPRKWNRRQEAAS